MTTQEMMAANATAPTPASGIHSSALLVALSLSAWSARKLDRKVTEEVNRRHAASKDAGRYNKMLLPGEAGAYHELVTVRNAARADHYKNTLAWSDEGWRLLPAANYMHYSEMMRAHSTAFDSAVATFAASYPEMKEAARELLNGMFNPSDYPDVSDIRGRFRFALEFSPLPTSGDFRLNLPAVELEAIAARVTDRIERAAAESVRDSWDRLAKVTRAMQERLSIPVGEKGSIFRDSLVDNARELVDVLARLNFTNDPALEAMRARIDRDLCTPDAAELREDPAIRADTAKKAADIMAAMSGLYGAAK